MYNGYRGNFYHVMDTIYNNSEREAKAKAKQKKEEDKRLDRIEKTTDKLVEFISSNNVTKDNNMYHVHIDLTGKDLSNITHLDINIQL